MVRITRLGGALVVVTALAAATAALSAQERAADMQNGATGGRYYREYWAERNEQRNNCPGRLLRVNDPAMSLDERFGHRGEARTNGLLLVDAPEDLFTLTGAELYLELWGGHPHTADKRFALNGRSEYALPEVGTEEGACTYSYPSVPLELGDLVQGWNAFQFTCDRGGGFWGHYIIDNACVRAYLAGDHPLLDGTDLGRFSAQVRAPSELGETVQVELDFPEEASGPISSVDYYARYHGFDDDGDGQELDWHGFTLHREPVNHVGTAESAPFSVVWDTAMIPDQDGPLALKAVVHLAQDVHYETEPLGGLRFAAGRPAVALYSCSEMPTPFWSRAGREQRATIRLPEDLSNVVRAELLLKVWDGGAGEVEEPFTLNGHPYNVVSGRSIHDVVFTRADVDPDHLVPGNNDIRLLSDTEHHGIEVLLPGPCLVLRFAD